MNNSNYANNIRTNTFPWKFTLKVSRGWRLGKCWLKATQFHLDRRNTFMSSLVHHSDSMMTSYHYIEYFKIAKIWSTLTTNKKVCEVMHILNSWI